MCKWKTDVLATYLYHVCSFMIRTGQDMIDFIHIVIVIARDKGVAMETVKLNIAQMSFFMGTLLNTTQ